MNLETILTAIKEGFASLNQTQVKLGKSMTIDEQAVFFEGEALAVDTMVFADEAMTEALTAGTYEIDEMMVVVTEGKVAELTEKEAEQPEAEAEVEMADDSVEAKVNEIMQAYVGEIAKAVAAQLEGFKAEMKKEEAEVILTKATPIHTEVAEPKNLQEKFLLELQKQN
jgi:predicted phage tail protein